MSRIEKALDRLRSRPADFTWSELEMVMRYFGYQLVQGSGSRRKFIHRASGAFVSLHQPHPKPVLKAYAIKLIVEHLKDEGLL
jgi:predicted RNA binding protein YcfA (HicA-like mRNA interferase family)